MSRSGTRITTNLFFAALSLHQRPSLCSCPTPATMNCPLGLMARLLTKPLTWILCTSLMLLKPSPTCQTLSHPSLEPVMTVSVLWRVVRAETQWGSSLLASVP